MEKEVGFSAIKVEDFKGFQFDKLTKDNNIADTGASCHLTNDLFGMYDLQDTNSDVKVGDGNKVKATKIGKVKVQVTH